MMIHHIGIATNNLKELKKEYLNKGYKEINETYDDTQMAFLCLLQSEKDCIELIYTNDTKSPVFNICSKNYNKRYHICYVVKDIRESIKEYQNNGYLLFKKITYAPLLKTNICFLYKSGEEVIELMEEVNDESAHI